MAVSTAEPEQRGAPVAFLCSHSHQVMDDPVLSLCGHLFDKHVIQSDFVCPVDRSRVVDYVAVEELKQRITAWRAERLSLEEASINTRVATHSSRSTSQEDQAAKKGRSTTQPISVIRNAHRDDIHGFVSLSSDRFVSGSKDNHLKMWNHDGECVKVLAGQSSQGGYQYWVTALSKFSNGYWASGTRDGSVTIWSGSGKELRSVQYSPAGGSDPKCKERNKTRIHCITELETTNKTTLFYTGTARYIQLWDAKNQKFLKGYRASSNDWVYCIEVLEDKNLLVVIGSDLQHWSMSDRSPAKTDLISENREARVVQRPHISAITRLEHNRDLLASALFDGSVKIVDIATRTLFRDYLEHKGRVWSVANLSPHLFASSADDASIKIWDVREPRSTLTIGGNPGRVSSLLRLSEQILISGSCPDRVFDSREKASICFWDIRKITAN